MATLCNVLSVINDFLSNVQSQGMIKEFSLVYDDINSDNSGADILLSEFLQKINTLSIPTKNSSSDEEYIIIDDEKMTESDSAAESPIKENIDNQTDANEVSLGSSCSATIEQVPSEMIPDKSKLDPSLVQITVDTNEMRRRISAFISRKRKEVDEWNVQEFCGHSYIDEQDPSWEQSNSCARIDAVFVPRRDCKGDIKASKVQSVWRPQGQPDIKKIKKESPSDANHPESAIEERLQNMEIYLKLKSDKTLRTNIFQRLKNLEDRIIWLESTSPEYIHMLNPDSSPVKKRSTDEKMYSNCRLDEIQKRIQTLKNSLKMKTPNVNINL